MNRTDIFNLQEQASLINVQQFRNWFDWCDNAIELMIDTHVFLGNDNEIVAYRKNLKSTNSKEFEAMNTIVNLDYDAGGSLISALRLVRYGVLADAWSLIRIAFESTCYSEYFVYNKEKVSSYSQIAEMINKNQSADIRKLIRTAKIELKTVMRFLKSHDGQDREQFYSRLSNLGIHASPVRCGFRMNMDDKTENRVYLSVGHHYLIQCIADFAATAIYTLSLPFDAWPDLIQKQLPLQSQYELLEKSYKTIFMPESMPKVANK